jgi:NAD(P)-dependent dehydrogenase (short-subunit alcohol dehydrogenase family)
MTYWRSYALILVVAIIAIFGPTLLEWTKSPRDERIGQIPIMSLSEMEKAYLGKRVLIVGGSRGVGLGTALAVARAGADVTIVGRSPTSGQAALDRLKQESALSAAADSAEISFLAGDIGSLASSHQLVADLEAASKKKRGFDYLVVTAAIFPDWSRPHQQEDGIDECFFIGVVGRYIVYKNMARFMNVSDDPTKNENVRVLNVMASGEMPVYTLPKDLASGKRDAKSLFESIMTFATGNELMLRILEEDVNASLGTTRVSTHPGLLKTDLHRGQGWLLDLAEFVGVMLKGISIEHCGQTQASILASPLLPKQEQSYVCSDMHGRLMHPNLIALQQTHQAWLKDFLDKLVDDKNTNS